MQLRRAGYLFSQLGGVFLVHYPHLPSKARAEWEKKPRASKRNRPAGDLPKEHKGNDWETNKRICVDVMFLDFKEWMDGTVEDKSRVPMSEDALNNNMRPWVHPGDDGGNG